MVPLRRIAGFLPVGQERVGAGQRQHQAAWQAAGGVGFRLREAQAPRAGVGFDGAVFRSGAQLAEARAVVGDHFLSLFHGSLPKAAWRPEWNTGRRPLPEQGTA